jgi:hypothetical protein
VRKPYSPKTIAKNKTGNPRQADVLGKHTNGHARLHPQGARQGDQRAAHQLAERFSSGDGRAARARPRVGRWGVGVRRGGGRYLAGPAPGEPPAGSWVSDLRKE